MKSVWTFFHSLNNFGKLLTVLLVLSPSFIYSQNLRRECDSLYKLVDSAKGENKEKIAARLTFLWDQLKTGYLDSLLKLEVMSKDDTNKIEIYRQIGKRYDQMRTIPDVEKALEYFTKELQLSQKLNYNVSIFHACNSIGAIYYRLCNYAEAEKYYLLGLSTNQKKASDWGTAISYSNMGSIYLIQKNYSEALKCYDTCLQHMLKYHVTEEVADDYCEIAEIYEGMKNYPEALKYSFLAWNTSKELWWLGQNGDGFALKNIGDIYLLQGNYTESRKYYSKVFTVQKGNGVLELFATTDLKLGELELGVKNYSLAKQYLNKGLFLAQKTGTKDVVSECYQKLAQLYAEANDYKNAFRYNNLYMGVKDSIVSTDASVKIAQMQMEYDFNRKQAEENALQEKKATMQKAELDKKNAILEVTIKRQHLLYFVFTVIVLLLLLLGLLIFNRFNLQKRLEKQLAISEERKRISADMHDDLGSGLSKISLLSALVKEDVTNRNAQVHLENISKSSINLVDKMGEIIWMLNSNYDKIEYLLIYIRKYAMEYFDSTEISCKVEFPEHIPNLEINSEIRRNIFLAVKESLHNVLKHSGAHLVTITVTINSTLLNVIIRDNGNGIDVVAITGKGNGLKNMKKRMEDIKSRFTVKNDNGTILEFNIPLPKSNNE